jgi:hypothetical protein
VLPYLLAERDAILGIIEPAFETSVGFAEILEIGGPRDVNVVSGWLVDAESEVVSC